MEERHGANYLRDQQAQAELALINRELKRLNQHLTEYLYNIYDSTAHAALGQTPREAFDLGLDRTGQRAHRWLRITASP